MTALQRPESASINRDGRRRVREGRAAHDVEATLRRLRFHQRSRVNVRAIVHAGLSSRQTIIRDISDGGLGLTGADGLFPGCEVRIALVTGESHTGIVRWWLAGSCGVQFVEPLGDDHPFRAAVQRKATASSA